MSKINTSPYLSIVIPSRANNLQLLGKILTCLALQTFQDFEILIVCDREFTEPERKNFQTACKSLAFEGNEEKIRLLSHRNTDFVPHHPWAASYVRNFWIKTAKGSYIQLFDDDNEFDAHYLEKVLELHKTATKKYQKEVFITPTLMWRNSDIIQNQWFSDYSYFLARPKIHFLKPEENFAEIKMFSGNGIFGKAEIMKKVLYDEEIAWIAEDLDFIYSVREQGTPILVFKALKIRHQERDKTYLEEARIGTASSAQQKIKNLFLWVKKHGNFIQTLTFFLRSSRGICGRLWVKALLYWKEARWSIIGGIIKGYIRWWGLFFRKEKD